MFKADGFSFAAHPTTSEMRQQSLNPLLRRYMVEYEPKSRRYNIHGILQDCLEVYFNIENLPGRHYVLHI